MSNKSLFAVAGAYWRTLQDYFHTEKGRHDILDYLRALFIITMLIGFTLVLLKELF